MWVEVKSLPFLVILVGIAAFSMLLPAAHALAVGSTEVARAFMVSCSGFLFLTVLFSLATANRKARSKSRSHLTAMLATMVMIPAMLAVPVKLALPDMTFQNAWLEMISCITTTGAPFISDMAGLPSSLHLWRAQVAWMGGFFVLVTAVAILAPMNLGGFEVLFTGESRTRRGVPVAADSWISDSGERLIRFSARLFPIYFGLTGFLWFLLSIGVNAPTETLILAMSTLSTSGILGGSGGFENLGFGFAGEFVILVFMLLALSRQIMMPDKRRIRDQTIWNNAELRIGAVFVLGIPFLLFMRHWLGAYEVDQVDNLSAALNALWGTLFMVASFVTTTGFESQSWETARNWSGLATPGLILMGMALIGGGVATTAGGVKLLRVYALAAHGLRELERLVHPSSIGGSGMAARRLRREGAYVAWVFFMLFALSLTLVVLAFAATGLNLNQSITLAIAGLSTTGPVTELSAHDPIVVANLSEPAKLVFAVTMVLGRLETLVIIALFNPDFWR